MQCSSSRASLELGESINDGLRREVREETGLDVEPISLTGIYKDMKRGIITCLPLQDHRRTAHDQR
jgi:ADP-ribose pyrophosphatase YjhB (NUDIX family)